MLCSAAAVASTDKKKKPAGNMVLRKGWMGTPGGWSGAKEQWFVLTSETLAWYKDQTEQKQVQLLRVEGLKLRDVQGGGGIFSGKKYQIEIYNPDQKYLFKGVCRAGGVGPFL
jgi:dynamin GTPase